MFIAYAVYGRKQGNVSELDAALITALDQIADKLEGGKSLESAFSEIGADKTNKAAPYFKQLLDTTRQGSSLQDALEAFAKKSTSRTFSYICDLIAMSERSRGNVAPSLKDLSRKLWDIHHLQSTIDSKAGKPILMLQSLGIFLLPSVYFFLATILQTQTLHTVDIIQSWLMLGYLLVVCISMTFLDWFIFRDAISSLMLLPVSLSFYLISILLLGPYIVQAIGVL